MEAVIRDRKRIRACLIAAALCVLVLIKVCSTRKTADETQTDNDTSQQP